jgi:cytochrome c2
MAGLWTRGALALLAAGLTAGTTVWALAPPERDPVAEGYRALLDHGRALVAWYEAKPVDAKPDWQEMRMTIPGASPDRGRALMKDYGCGACHIIPRVTGARGTVGPPLTAFADRAYIAGVLGNTPGGLTRWLVNPPLHSPNTAMPDLGVTEADARDMTAFLYTLGDDG